MTGYLMSCVGCLIAGFCVCLLMIPRIMDWSEPGREMDNERLRKKLGISTCKVSDAG